MARYKFLEIFLCVLSAELYSYTEGPEFLLNRKCFEEDFRIHGKTLPLDLLPLWGGTETSQRRCRD